MNLEHIKGIVFDAEGVVVDTEILWDKSQHILLGRRGLEYDREYLKPRMAGQNMAQGAQTMIDYYKLDELAAEMAEERKEIIHGLFEHEIHFMNGFEPFIQRLQETALYKSVATAMQKTLMVKVEKRLNIRDYFGDHIYFIEDVGNRSKPEPDVFLHAAEKMGLDPDQCLVIEDAPHGIEAARRAGMISMGLATTFSAKHLQRADIVASDFESALLYLQEAGLNLS